jgi:hypothetical protein
MYDVDGTPKGLLITCDGSIYEAISHQQPTWLTHSECTITRSTCKKRNQLECLVTNCE